MKIEGFVILLQVILIFSIIQFKPARYENYVFPPWGQGVGWVIAMASIIWIPLCAVHTLWVLPGSFLQVTYVWHLPRPPLKSLNSPLCVRATFTRNQPVLIISDILLFYLFTETEAVTQTRRTGWKVKDGILWKGRKSWRSGDKCHQLQQSTWKNSYRVYIGSKLRYLSAHNAVILLLEST